MKTAIYIEGGVTQLVLTPENEFEKNVLGSFADKKLTTNIFQGTFYDCRGGWARQKDYYPSGSEDRSLIIRTEPD